MSEQQIPPTEPMPEEPTEGTDKLEARSLTETSSALRWLDNFWYHYKWTCIVAVFFVSVAIVCLVQLLSRPKYDTSMVFATHYRMNNEERADFEDLLNRICPEDFNDDGEKKVNLVVYQVYSEDEYQAEAESYAQVESDRFVLNGKYNNDEIQNFNQYAMTGETSVYIVSPYLYQNLLEGKRLKPLSEVYSNGQLPAGARADGCGIDFAKTDFYMYNPAAQSIPDTAILCVLRPTISGNSSEADTYADELAFFRAIADYRVKTE